MIGPERPREIHALWNGFFSGYYGLDIEPVHHDSETELHYYRFGYFVGDVVGPTV